MINLIGFLIIDFFAIKDLKRVAFLLRALAVKANKNKYEHTYYSLFRISATFSTSLAEQEFSDSRSPCAQQPSAPQSYTGPPQHISHQRSLRALSWNVFVNSENFMVDHDENKFGRPL